MTKHITHEHLDADNYYIGPDAELPIFAGTTTRIKPDRELTQIHYEKLNGTIAHGEPVFTTPYQEDCKVTVNRKQGR